MKQIPDILLDWTLKLLRVAKFDQKKDHIYISIQYYFPQKYFQNNSYFHKKFKKYGQKIIITPEMSYTSSSVSFNI